MRARLYAGPVLCGLCGPCPEAAPGQHGRVGSRERGELAERQHCPVPVSLPSHGPRVPPADGPGRSRAPTAGGCPTPGLRRSLLAPARVMPAVRPGCAGLCKARGCVEPVLCGTRAVWNPGCAGPGSVRNLGCAEPGSGPQWHLL